LSLYMTTPSRVEFLFLLALPARISRRVLLPPPVRFN